MNLNTFDITTVDCVFAGIRLSRTREHHLWSIKLGEFLVFFATIDGKITHYGEGPWIWNTMQEATEQIAKWR